MTLKFNRRSVLMSLGAAALLLLAGYGFGNIAAKAVNYLSYEPLVSVSLA